MLVFAGEGLDVAARLEAHGLIGLALSGGPGSGAGEAEHEDREVAGSHQSAHVVVSLV